MIIAALVAFGSWFATPTASATTPEQLLWTGNIGAALESAQAQAAANPSDVGAQELIIDILLSIGLPDRAATLARARVAASPGEATAHYLLGRALVRVEDATKAYEAALRISPDHARAHMGMAAIHLAQGRDAEALAAYTRAVKLDPRLAEAWVAIGRIHVVRGDSAAALSVAHTALEHVQDEPSLYLLAASLEPQRADEWLKQAIAVAPRDPSLHQLRGDLLLDSGDAAGAAKEVELALAINPTLVDAQRTRAFTSAVLSGRLDVAGVRELAAVHDAEGADPSVARARYTVLIARYPECPIPLVARSQVSAKLGDPEGALSDLERALALAPKETETQMFYGLHQLRAGRADLARPWLARAQEARPWDAALSLALGRALRELGDAPTARLVLDEAWRLHRWDPNVAIAAAQARVDAGDGEAAYQLVREAMPRMSDPRLAVALVTTATAAGRFEEAAKILEDLGRQTGRQTLTDAATRLRAQAASRPTTSP